MSEYELAILGDADHALRQNLTEVIREKTAQFQLPSADAVRVHDAVSIESRAKHAAFAAVYFGGDPQLDRAVVDDLVGKKLPIIPTVSNDVDFTASVPPSLRPINGLIRNPDIDENEQVANTLLEALGLLRKQRRSFISYRRSEAREAALQLYDLLSERHYDAFLDTHGVPIAEPFQDVLWHRLCDSDFLLMLDTPSYFQSRWTTEEFGKATAHGMMMVRVVWPNHTPEQATSFAQTINLNNADISGAHGRLSDKATAQILSSVERVRSESVGHRYKLLAGKLGIAVKSIGGEFEGVGAHRAMSLRLPDQSKVWAYPVVGVPTAEVMNDISDKAEGAQQNGVPILVYDEIGLKETWRQHLKWLDSNLDAVKAIRVHEAASALASLEDA